jgi:hypothetical protein
MFGWHVGRANPEKRDYQMKMKAVVLALAVALTPAVSLAWGGDYESEYGGEYTEPEGSYGYNPVDEVWEIIARECSHDEGHEGGCPEADAGHPEEGSGMEEGPLPFLYCAMNVVEELYYWEEICESVYMKVKIDIEVEISFHEGFKAGFEEGKKHTVCAPPEGGEGEEQEAEGGNEEEEGSEEGSEEEASKQKVVICHIPPGNPANAHTIEVGAPAVQAHLNHGDVLGSCEEDIAKGEKKKKKKKKKKKRGKKRGKQHS